MWAITLGLASAWGGETALLRDGPTALDPCLADEDCAQAAREQIADALRDGGLAAEFVGIGTHAALSGATGVAVEVGAQSFALPPGASGLQPVGVVPVVPRLALGFVGGDDVADVRAAFAVHVAPPIPVDGDVAWSSGLQLSVAWSDPSQRAWAGFDLDVGLTVGWGSLVDADTLASLDPDIVPPPCGEVCRDTFEQLHGAVGSTLRYDLDPAAPVFAGFGGVMSRQTFTAAADGSSWSWSGLQPRARLGAGYRPAPSGLVALALNMGLKGPATTARSRFTWTAIASAAWTFGPSPVSREPILTPGYEPADEVVEAPVPAPALVIPVIPRASHPELTCGPDQFSTGAPPPQGLEAWCVRVADHGEVLRHGPYMRWWSESIVAERGEFQDGQAWHQWSEYDRAGTLVAQGGYEAGARHGLWTKWYGSGLMESRGEYMRGNEHGVWVYWSGDGGGRTEGAWTNGRREGIWLDYGPDGEARGERHYRGGRLIHSSTR